MYGIFLLLFLLHSTQYAAIGKIIIGAFVLEVINYAINIHQPLDMISEISANKGADIIVDYVRKNAFWKEIYFNLFYHKTESLVFPSCSIFGSAYLWNIDPIL